MDNDIDLDKSSEELDKEILSYFHLFEQPFRLGPDIRFLYNSDQVKESVAKCIYMARQRVGPVYMYGPFGSGKSTIIRRLAEILSKDERFNVAFLITPNLKSSNSFIRIVMESFGVKTERAYDRSLKNFEQFLFEQQDASKVPVLLIDEAQNINRDSLKLLHYLLNFETASVKLLQVVICGQQELAEQILRYRELASRMFPIATNAMTPEELRAMIEFRWSVAGGKDEDLPYNPNDEQVFDILFTYTKGLPRDTIKVLDDVLRELFANGKKKIAPSEVEQIAKEQNLRI